MNLEGFIKSSDAQKERKDLYDILYALNKSAIVAITDPQGNILFANELFCKTSQYSREELIGKNHRILNSGYHSKEFFKEMWRTIGNGKIWHGEICNRRKDGTRYWVYATIVPFLNEKGKPYQYISIRTDITKEKELEEEIRKSNEKYRLITENSSDLIALINHHGDFHYVSPSFESLLETKLTVFENGNLFHFVHKDDHQLLRYNIRMIFQKKSDIVQLEFRMKNQRNEDIDVEANINMVKDQFNNKRDLLLIVIRDIRVRKKIEEKIYHLAFHDSLTGLPNRRLFMNTLHNEIVDRRYSKMKLAILFIDLDDFKIINDQFGHDKGDLILIEAAERIKNAIRPTDTVARLGSDEFIILLKDIYSEDEARKYAHEIIQCFQKPVTLEENRLTLTCSIGIAIYPEHGIRGEELLKNADAALTRIKGKGKNGFLLFDKQLQTESFERRLLENALRSAILNKQFYLEYQPKYNFKDRSLIGMEALVRWDHPDLGKIPPGKFIPLAEETGLIHQLGEWILYESCRQNIEWQQKGYKHMPVSVNVSVRQLTDPDFVLKVDKILQETNLDPQWLEIEVTESVFADLENAAFKLEQIRNLGIHISIDDFGTGYSSLSYIKHLPIDTLKVDQSFVKDIHQNEESRAIIKAVITLAKSIGINVIAEGVETKEHMIRLIEEGCNLGQGYYFSRPLSVHDFEQLMENSKEKRFIK